MKKVPNWQQYPEPVVPLVQPIGRMWFIYQVLPLWNLNNNIHEKFVKNMDL